MGGEDLDPIRAKAGKSVNDPGRAVNKSINFASMKQSSGCRRARLLYLKSIACSSVAFLALLITTEASAQFFFERGSLCLVLYNTKNKVVSGAVVRINGMDMFPETAPGGRAVYRIDTAKLGGSRYELEQRKFHFRITHPGHQTVNDSLYLAPDRVYLGSKNDDHIYQWNKRPVTIHSGYYFVQPYTDSTTFRQAMDSLGVRVLDSYLYCKGMNKHRNSGPLIFIVRVPKRAEKAFLSWPLCEPAVLVSDEPLLSRSAMVTGISVRLSFQLHKGILPEQLQARFREIALISASAPGSQHYTIAVRKQDLPRIMRITEKLVRSGWIEKPENQLLLFDCPTQ